MVLISLIIPVYNVEKYVQRCLESVINQEIFNAEVECIIVDDCGQDHSIDIVQHIIEKYQGPIRFALYHHDTNRGLSASRNTGLCHAIGDYVFFIDSDDYLMPDSLQYFLENLKQYPNVDMVIGNVKNCKGGDLMIKKIKQPCSIDDCNVFFRQMLHHQIYLYVWNKLIRRDLLINNHIVFEEGIIYEDMCWSYELFSLLSSILLLPKVTYVYENNPNSIINAAFTKEKGEMALKSYTLSVNKMLNNPPNPIRYRSNMMVDYMLFMVNFMMGGVDVHSRCPISAEILQDFCKVKKRILYLSMSYGRFLLSCFVLLLFPPLRYLKKIQMFRHHFYDIESFVNKVCHLTDFMHKKDKIRLYSIV